MAKKKKDKTPKLQPVSGVIEGAGEVAEQHIVSTIQENFMPYAMSLILSRAIPEIDGFKPSHRKLLYMMYKMGLLTGSRTKSANIVGARRKVAISRPIPTTTVILSRPNRKERTTISTIVWTGI